MRVMVMAMVEMRQHLVLYGTRAICLGQQF